MSNNSYTLKDLLKIFAAASAVIPFLVISLLLSRVSEKNETIKELNQEISQHQEIEYDERQTEQLQRVVAMLTLCDQPSYQANETFTSTELNNEYDLTVHGAKITMYEEDWYEVSVFFSFENKSINPIRIEAGYNLFLIDECGRVLEDDSGYIEDNELTYLSGALDPGRSYDHVKVDFTARTMTDTVYVIFSDTFLSLYPIEFRLEKDDLAEIADNTVRYCIQVE